MGTPQSTSGPVQQDVPHDQKTSDLDNDAPNIDEFKNFGDGEIRSRAVLADADGVTNEPTVQTEDLEPGRDEVRKWIAFWLLGILTLVVASTLGFLVTERWTGLKTDDIRSVVELIFAPVVTLISAVTGFYYASSAQQRGTQPKPARNKRSR